jgi:DNA-binding YbaB/EbfC family protein
MRNLQDMMGQIKKMQEDVLQKMELLRVEGSAGGGIVTVEMNGSKKVLRVRIDPAAVKDSDVEMLQDLIQASVNDAARKVDDALKNMLGGLTGGMKIPGLF